jgi:hypothetical protein
MLRADWVRGVNRLRDLLTVWVRQTRAPAVTSGFVKYNSLASYDT